MSRSKADTVQLMLTSLLTVVDGICMHGQTQQCDHSIKSATLNADHI